jgi:hypothetical protein
MKIELNEEAFDGVADHTRETFMVLINSELEKLAGILCRKASIWMFQLKHPNFGDSDEVD